MRIDYSAAEQFLSFVDDDASLTDVWDHPAYAIARTHAELLGKDLSKTDIAEAMANERTAFANVDDLKENRERITRLIRYVRANETDWTERIERHLARTISDEDASDLTVFLAIGYELGIGTQRGAYVNLNESLFFETPRQLLYVALHESSHVLYDRVHDFSNKLGVQELDSLEGQRTFFNTVLHTEAFATYTPLELRRSDGNVGGGEHAMCEDYRVLADEKRLRRHVEEYDSFRTTLGEGPEVSRETLLTRTFGGLRLPYRIGCALLEGLEEKRGFEAVRRAFFAEPAEFVTKYDWVLDDYRKPS